MSIAHVCMGCGLDLARVRPFREPHYGLALIVCPRCSLACVRRRHPLQHGWRAYLRLSQSSGTFLGQLLLMTLLMTSTVAQVGYLAEEVHFRTALDSWSDQPWLWRWSMFVALLLGVWLTAGLSHIALWRSWLGWWCAAAVLLSMPLWMSKVAVAFEIPHLLWHVGNEDARWTLRLVALTGYMTFAAAGIPLGRLLLRAYARHRASKWRKRRRKWRARRIVA